ncbi:hypothetical protein MFRU_036g00360 [Monilinia fructicola]|nr:hypothetical protein MFRU_036g00360 [Monilinia fructicola]
MQKIDEASRRTARSRTPTACLQCQKRKQKCSREQPCRHCSRRYPPVECIYTYEGRHRVVPFQSPNRLSIPDDTPASFYTNPKILPSRMTSAHFPHSFSSTVQKYGLNEGLERIPSQGDMSSMAAFAPSSSESFISKSSYQAVSSSATPSPDTVSFSCPEADSNQLDLSSLPQVPTSTPNRISNYDHLGAQNLGEQWNQNSSPNANTGMINFQSFNQSYLVPIPTPTDVSQFLDTDGSQSFHQIDENHGAYSFGDTADMSFPEETVEDQNQNRGYEATDDYFSSFY